jgi:hypothetical protein
MAAEMSPPAAAFVTPNSLTTTGMMLAGAIM